LSRTPSPRWLGDTHSFNGNRNAGRIETVVRYAIAIGVCHIRQSVVILIGYVFNRAAVVYQFIVAGYFQRGRVRRWRSSRVADVLWITAVAGHHKLRHVRIWTRKEFDPSRKLQI